MNNYTCCICGVNQIKPLQIDYTTPPNQEITYWDGGTVDLILFGYGSKHDMNSYYVAICGYM